MAGRENTGMLSPYRVLDLTDEKIGGVPILYEEVFKLDTYDKREK